MKKALSLGLLLMAVTISLFFTACEKEDFTPQSEEFEAIPSEEFVAVPTDDIAPMLEQYIQNNDSIPLVQLRGSSYHEFTGYVTTQTTYTKYSNLKCVVRYYPDSKDFMVYVKRRYDVFKKAYVPSPKKGDVSLLDTRSWRSTGRSSSSWNWTLGSKSFNAASVWLSTSYYGPQTMNISTGATMQFFSYKNNLYLFMNGKVTSPYSTNVKMLIQLG